MQDDLLVTTTPISEPIAPEVQPVVLINNDQQPKQNNFLIILLSILLFLSILIAGFFAFKTQNLVKELTLLKTIPAFTSEPTTEPIATPDPTADWELYTNVENGYSIKFPKTEYTRLGCIGEELTAAKYGTDNRPSPMTMVACERDGRYSLETKTYASIQSEPAETKYYNIVKKDVQMGGILGKLYIHTFTNIEDGPYPEWFTVAQVNKNNKTYEIYFSDKAKLDLFNQIISTFKFTN